LYELIGIVFFIGSDADATYMKISSMVSNSSYSIFIE